MNALQKTKESLWRCLYDDETFFCYFSSYLRGQLVSIVLARKLWKRRVLHEHVKLIEEAFLQLLRTVQVVRY